MATPRTRIELRRGSDLAIIMSAIGNEGPALAAACRDAVARGAIMVVAAMTRDGAANLVRSDCASAYTALFPPV